MTKMIINELILITMKFMQFQYKIKISIKQKTQRLQKNNNTIIFVIKQDHIIKVQNLQRIFLVDNHFNRTQRNQFLMFKIKQTKKSVTSLVSINGENKFIEKKGQLSQNDDYLNIHSHQDLTQGKQSLEMTQKNPLRNASLRPRSGFNRIQKYAQQNKNSLNGQELIRQKIKQKTMNNKMKRPQTSQYMDDLLMGIEKRNKLTNRKGTLSSSTNLPPKSMKSMKMLRDHDLRDQSDSSRRVRVGNLSVEEGLVIIQRVLNSQQEYLRLKQKNRQQSERVRQRLLSNLHIMLLKWGKIVDERARSQKEKKQVYKQVSQQEQRKAGDIEEFIIQQVRRIIGYQTFQEQCIQTHNRVQQMIEGRLQRLFTLLTVK